MHVMGIEKWISCHLRRLFLIAVIMLSECNMDHTCVGTKLFIWHNTFHICFAKGFQRFGLIVCAAQGRVWGWF